MRLEGCQGGAEAGPNQQDIHKDAPRHQGRGIITGNEVGCKSTDKELSQGSRDAENRAEEKEGNDEVEEVFA